MELLQDSKEKIPTRKGIKPLEKIRRSKDGYVGYLARSDNRRQHFFASLRTA